MLNRLLFTLLVFIGITPLYTEFTIDGAPPFLSLSEAEAGGEVQSVHSSSQTYTVSSQSFGEGMISAQLASSLPEGTSLSIDMEAPPNAQYLGKIALVDGKEYTLVRGIQKGRYTGLKISYTFSGSITTPLCPPNSQLVIFKYIEPDSF